MAYLGRYQLGQTLTATLQCVDADSAPTIPDRVPQLKVFLTTAVVEAKLMPVQDKFIQTGQFTSHIFIGSLYGAGFYNIVYYYTTGALAFNGIESDTFEVVAGGHADGAVLSMYFFRKPHADFVLQETEDGLVVSGRNPVVG